MTSSAQDRRPRPGLHHLFAACAATILTFGLVSPSVALADDPPPAEETPTPAPDPAEEPDPDTGELPPPTAIWTEPEQVASPSAGAVVRVEGHGWGHGRGMGQYGAYGYSIGQAGQPWSSARILDHFYGGTRSHTLPQSTEMSVRLLSRDGESTIVTRSEGALATKVGTNQAYAIRDAAVKITVSGTDRFVISDGPSCSGPWTTRPGTVAASEISVVPHSADRLSASYGSPGEIPVWGDWNGDGVDTIGVFDQGTWRLRNSASSGPAHLTFGYGRAGDTPVVGDWNGDGVDTVGIRRSNVFSLRNSNTAGPADITLGYGRSTDTPVVGDFDGDGVDTFGVRRNNAYYLRNRNTTGVADIIYGYGSTNDKPIVGDWDGNGTDTPGVLRGTTFLLRNASSSGPAQVTVDFGVAGTPVAGDWSREGRSRVGVFTGSEWQLDVPSQSEPQGEPSLARTLRLCNDNGSSVYYRGTLRAVNYAGSQRTVNDVPLDDYVRGVVPRESPPSWGDANGGTGMASLEAQSVAARSYSYAENRYPYAKTCDTTACQVYRGRGYRAANGAVTIYEDRRTDTAAANTARMVRVYESNGRVARTEFSSSTGGHTIGPGISPFAAVPDHGDSVSSNANHDWLVELDRAALASRYCGSAAMDSIGVTSRLSEDGGRRAGTIEVTCAGGTKKQFTGDQFRIAMGLRERYFDLIDDVATGPGIFRDGAFHLRNDNGGGAADRSFGFGTAGDTPLAGDWNGDGIDTIGVRRSNVFHLRNSNTAGAATHTFSFGSATDIPLVADVNGDGRDDIGVRRGDTLFFTTNAPNNAVDVTIVIAALEPGDRVFATDVNGDGTDDIGWLRGTVVTFQGGLYFSVPANGVPLPADLPGGGGESMVVVSGQTWWVLSEPLRGPVATSFAYGVASDQPVSGRWE